MFTDRLWDPDSLSECGIRSGCGAAMYDPEDGTLEAVGIHMNKDLVHFLSEGGRARQRVGQAELVPCAAARQNLAPALREPIGDFLHRQFGHQVLFDHRQQPKS